jgi:hypothetical protein
VYLFANFKGDKMFFSSMAMFSVGEFALLIAQESTKFNIGIDLVSIAAAVVVITAVLMSLTLKYSDRLYQPTFDYLPWKFRQKLDRFADYIKSISEEMDLDNKYSRGLKNNFFKTLIVGISILLVIFGWRKLATIMSNDLSIIGYIITILILGTLMFYFIQMVKKILKSIADIFENATIVRSTHHSRVVVRKAFFGISVFWIALLWPFVIFILNLDALYIIVSFVLLGLAIWQFHDISKMIIGKYDTSKESVNIFKTTFGRQTSTNNTKSLNTGWKF